MTSVGVGLELGLALTLSLGALVLIDCGGQLLEVFVDVSLQLLAKRNCQSTAVDPHQPLL